MCSNLERCKSARTLIGRILGFTCARILRDVKGLHLHSIAIMSFTYVQILRDVKVHNSTPCVTRGFTHVQILRDVKGFDFFEMDDVRFTRI